MQESSKNDADLVKMMGGGSGTLSIDSADARVAGEESVPIRVPLVDIRDKETMGTVTVEFDLARNRNYQRYAIRVFASTKCDRGDEDLAAKQLVTMLSPIVDDLEIRAEARLTAWNQ